MNTPSEPLVTVGIPTYNRPEGLERTLRAITGQSYRNLEILVSDNCSPDPRVGEVVARFTSSDPRVRYIRQKTNLGAAGNFFALVALAHGSYFMWAADDDWWDAEFVATSVGLLQDNSGAAVAVTGFVPLPDPGGKPRLLAPAFDNICKLKEPDTYQRLMRYIRQKDAFGKAHIAYGLFPTSTIRQAVETLNQIVPRVMPIAEFERVDIFLNFVVLTMGDLALSPRCLRQYSAGARKSVDGIKSRSRGYDPNFLNCMQFMAEVVQQTCLSSNQKKSLLTAIRRRLLGYKLERIGRKLVIYRLYWSVYKRFRFVKC